MGFQQRERGVGVRLHVPGPSADVRRDRTTAFRGLRGGIRGGVLPRSVAGSRDYFVVVVVSNIGVVRCVLCLLVVLQLLFVYYVD